jgi:hypothetical protein
MIASGRTLRQVAKEMNIAERGAAIINWANSDPVFAQQYSRALAVRWEQMADELVELADDPCIGPDGVPNNALVQQRRLQVDTRKWLLSKMLPRKFGDKIEISSDPDAPIVTRIELVGVHPQQIEPPTIDASDNMPGDATNNISFRRVATAGPEQAG